MFGAVDLKQHEDEMRKYRKRIPLVGASKKGSKKPRLLRYEA